MSKEPSTGDNRTDRFSDRDRRFGYLIALTVVICLIAWLMRPPHEPFIQTAATQHPSPQDSTESPIGVGNNRLLIHGNKEGPALTAQEIVAAKLVRFSRSRRDLAVALSRRHGVTISGDIEKFFTAVESGNWTDITNAFSKINGGDSSAGHSEGRSPGTEHLWPAIIDAFGAAEQVHEWPAQQLLDYGNSILASLRPGMIYVGGSDSGRWIPELLNDTNDEERHIVITQNGLADNTYLDYLQLQYGDQLSTLSTDDSTKAFSDYVSDAQRRLEHDQQFPDEPKQIRPGEDVRMEDGKIQVGGHVAVMTINEALLKALMDKNPDIPIAIQQSFPLRGTYSDALPIGGLMELRAQDGEKSFTAERANESVDYWRNMAQQVSSNAEAKNSPETMKSYAHDANSASDLLAAHHFTKEAEEGYRIATQLWPGNPEATSNLANLLAQNGRNDEAQQVLRNFTAKYPGELREWEKAGGSTFLIGSPAKTSP